MRLRCYDVLDDAKRAASVDNVGHDSEHTTRCYRAPAFRDDYYNAWSAQKTTPTRRGLRVRYYGVVRAQLAIEGEDP
jgi:hypothetical protein